LKGVIVKVLTNPEALEQALAQSHVEPVFIFKHSTACPISGEAHQRVTTYIKAAEEPPALFMVRVIEDRPVSNLITEALKVPHASPQLILVKNGKAAWDVSHLNISADAIRDALRSA
jgi:bacillithiol system protein YtxJ